MPSNNAILTINGMSTSSAAGFGGQPFWLPESDASPPMNISCQLVVSSTSATSPSVNVEVTLDYVGTFSSNINGWLSSLATWFTLQDGVLIGSTRLTNAASNAFGAIVAPVSALRLNSTGGSSVQTIVAKFLQAG